MAIKQELLIDFVWNNAQNYFTSCKTIDSKDVIIEEFGFECSNPTTAGFDYCGVEYICNGVKTKGNMKICNSTMSWNRWKVRNLEQSQNISLVLVLKDDSIMGYNDNTDIIAVNLPQNLQNRYTSIMMGSRSECCDLITSFNSLKRADFFDNLIVERLEYKINYVKELYQERKNDSYSTLLFLLFDSLMIGTKNRKPMGQLCKIVGYNSIICSLDSLEQFEALLMGCAGLLESGIVADKYIYDLRERYHDISRQYKLMQMPLDSWVTGSFSGTKSVWTQIAQLAAILHKNRNLLHELSQSRTIEQYHSILTAEPSKYWQENCLPSMAKSRKSEVTLTLAHRERIIINGLIPFVGFYNIIEQFCDDEDIRTSMVDLLMKTKAENNSIVSKWTGYGVLPMNGAETQALIHLYKLSCTPMLCHKCRVGRKILMQSVIK